MSAKTIGDLLDKHFPKPKTKTDKRRAVEDIKLAKSLGITVKELRG